MEVHKVNKLEKWRHLVDSELLMNEVFHYHQFLPKFGASQILPRIWKKSRISAPSGLRAKP